MRISPVDAAKPLRVIKELASSTAEVGLKVAAAVWIVNLRPAVELDGTRALTRSLEDELGPCNR